MGEGMIRAESRTPEIGTSESRVACDGAFPLVAEWSGSRPPATNRSRAVGAGVAAVGEEPST